MKLRAVPLSIALTIAGVATLWSAQHLRATVERLAGPVRVHAWEDEDRSHDRARRANETGEILAIAEIYARARHAVPGRILEAELERSHGIWVYELKILNAQGRLVDLKVNAANGEILHREDD